MLMGFLAFSTLQQILELFSSGDAQRHTYLTTTSGGFKSLTNSLANAGLFYVRSKKRVAAHKTQNLSISLNGL